MTRSRDALGETQIANASLPSNMNRVRGATTDHPGKSDSTRGEKWVQFSVVVSNDWYSPVACGSQRLFG